MFVQFHDCSLLEHYLRDQKPAQQEREVPYMPIPSRSLRRYYFHPSDSIDGFSVVLGDWSVASWKNKRLSQNIQPMAFRAQEVLLKASWDETVDWWNLVAFILEIYRAIRMFSGMVRKPGEMKSHYDFRMHLAEMVDFFGPFPRTLLDKGNPDLVKDVFGDDGTVTAFPPEFIRRDLGGLLEGLNKEDWERFASFLRCVMELDRSERPDVKEILMHPWLGALSRA